MFSFTRHCQSLSKVVGPFHLPAMGIGVVPYLYQQSVLPFFLILPIPGVCNDVL